MQKVSLDALARQQVHLAATAGGGHTAETVYRGQEKVLRQTDRRDQAASRSP
jgi:hypothetical protein